jgi:hypothetical protein
VNGQEGLHVSTDELCRKLMKAIGELLCHGEHEPQINDGHPERQTLGTVI